MKTKILALVAILCLGTVSCSAKTEENSYYSPEESASTVSPTLESEVSPDEVVKLPDSAEAMKKSFADVPSIDEGPVISISNTTAKAGGTAEVTVSVKGADLNWSNCGIHLTYPDVLKCVYQDNDDLLLDYKKGIASEYNIGIVAMEWKKENNPPEELISQNLGTMFFTVMFSGNNGQDGDIITLYLKVPEDAESGTVYPIDFYYKDTDMFKNLEGDPSFEKYAFEHIQAGSITVE